MSRADTNGTCSNSIQASQVLDDLTSYADATWVSIKQGGNQRLLIGCVYRSGTPATAAKYDSDLHNTLRTMSNSSEFHHFNHKEITWDQLAPADSRSPGIRVCKMFFWLLPVSACHVTNQAQNTPDSKHTRSSTVKWGIHGWQPRDKRKPRTQRSHHHQLLNQNRWAQ